MDVNSLSSSFPAASSFDALTASQLGSDFDPSRLAELGKGGNAEAAEAAERLEGLFASMLVKEMRSSLSDGFFGEGSSGDIYGGWFDEHVGKSLARDGALNLAGMIKANLYAKTSEAAETTEKAG
jgi:Rod binding domain-containing protein